MKKYNIFNGVTTALVTPFKNGEVDFQSFEASIERGCKANVHGFVVTGTTGESPTLEDSEKLDLYKFTVEKVAGRAWVIAGTGSNNTQHTIKLSLQAQNVGVDGLLLVTPYYNKPNQDCLQAHYSQIASHVNIPICVYNVPGRTNVNLQVKTLNTLSKDVSSIQAIKEASGSLDTIKSMIAIQNPSIDVISGDDHLYFASLCCGAKGVISVASNIAPSMMVQTYELVMQNRLSEALLLDKQLHSLYRDLFLDVNPIPVKVLMSMLGWCQDEFRLPLMNTSSGYQHELMTLASLVTTGQLC